MHIYTNKQNPIQKEHEISYNNQIYEQKLQ